MPTRRSRISTDGPPSRRRFVGASVIGLLVASALVLGACSSTNNSSSSTSSSTPSGTASLTSLEKWPTASVSVQETGSSLLYPLFNLWVKQIETSWPNVSITTGSTGSGTGISDAANGTVQIGASDAYLSPAQLQTSPTLENIPLAISAQEVNYNVPGLSAGTHLKLNGAVLADMYTGKVTNWNNAEVTALNPGVNIPSVPVVTVHRSDSSGDTFLFSSYLTASAPQSWTLSPGTTVAWPNVAGAVAAQGNGGMVNSCKANPGCVAYIGVSYLNQASGAGLGYAALQNKAGNYELPTQATSSAAAASFTSRTPASGTISMIDGPASTGYPIVNYEYAIVNKTQSSALVAQAVKAILAWSIDPNNGNAPTYLDNVNFVALPPQVVTISAKLISKIS
ncbi:MAG TPA: phosphate ABC transporter substrate-binding protein PstS [Acidimicrobiaceae bacterium]|nr:phosphate ABC transporter substrate-binding protein PstS [Acidimicrobiaceae bacterium]